MIDVERLILVQAESYASAGPGLAGSWPPESAMDGDELRSFLEDRHYCVLATSNAAGHPVARPVAFTVLAGAFWFATVRGARLRNLEHTPWASLVIEDGDQGAHRAVAVDGPVTISEHPPLDLLGIWEERHGSRAEWAAAWFELEPSRLVSYLAGKRQ
jgi:general stress protein 26